MTVTQAAVIDWAKPEWALANELADRPFYLAGYNLSTTNNITASDIINALSGVINGNSVYSYRKWW